MRLGKDVLIGLSAVAWADGVVTDDEARALDAAAEACGLEPDDLADVRRATHEPVTLDALDGLALSQSERMFVYAIACWLARADGAVVAAERATLKALRGRLELSERESEVAHRAQVDVGASAADIEELARSIAEAAVEDEGAAPETLPLPPGTFGWPVIGETLAFVSDPFAWVAERAAKHGPVFKSRVLGRRVAVITGPEAHALWIDGDKLMRDGAMFKHVFGLFGGLSLPAMDGAAHQSRKQQVLAGFDRAALESYLPAIRAGVTGRLERLCELGETAWIDELRQLAIELIARDVVGLAPGKELQQLVDDYGAVTRGFGAIPIDLPGTTLNRANKARDRLIEFMGTRIDERRREPGDDGLSRILKKPASDGTRIDDRGAAIELHHIFLAGYIVFAELAGMVMRLAAATDVRDALVSELDALGDDSLAALMRMPLLDRVILETKRITPMLPIIFARARQDVAFADSRIPKGWLVCLGLTASHQLPDVFAEPEQFDPERFGPERSEHNARPHAYAPQGPGPDTGHRCAGVDYSSVMMKVFAVELLRGYRFELPEQDLRYDYALIPPEPKAGLRVRLTRR